MLNGNRSSANASKPELAPHRTRSRARARPSVGFEAVDFALVGLSIGCSIHQQHTKKKDQIEHRKHEQATSGLPFPVVAPTYLP
jgi:surface antigen